MIVRYFEWGIFNPDAVFPVWEEILTKEDIKGGRKLTREEAVEIIKEQGLQLVHVSRHGQIYDVPSEEFKKSFEGDTVDNYLNIL